MRLLYGFDLPGVQDYEVKSDSTIPSTKAALRGPEIEAKLHVRRAELVERWSGASVHSTCLCKKLPVTRGDGSTTSASYQARGSTERESGHCPTIALVRSADPKGGTNTGPFLFSSRSCYIFFIRSSSRRGKMKRALHIYKKTAQCDPFFWKLAGSRIEAKTSGRSQIKAR